MYREFMRRWPSPARLARARVETITRVVHPLGLGKRARLLARLGDELDALGDVPTDPVKLRALPGVGPYTANAVAIFAAGRQLPLADWVLARVLRRYFGLRGEKRPNSDPELWELSERLVGAGRARDMWLGALDFAAATCKPRPLCTECPLFRECSYPSRLHS